MRFKPLKKPTEQKSIRITVRLFVYSSLLFLITILGGTSFYLYRFVYQAFLFSEENIQLKTVVAPETFNIESFKSILENIKKKQDQSDLPDWSNAQNIFLKVRTVSETTLPQDSPEPAASVEPVAEGPTLQ